MVIVLKLLTGESIVGELDSANQYLFRLKNPIKAIVTYESFESPPRVYYMPLNELTKDEEVEINAGAVAYKVNASDDIANFYIKNIQKMIEAQNNLRYAEETDLEFDLHTADFQNKTLN